MKFNRNCIYNPKEAALFDVTWVYGLDIEYRSYKGGFTGNTHRYFYIRIEVLRFDISLDFEWAFKNIGAKEACRMYKSRQKEALEKWNKKGQDL